jgi:hypothetical protein
MPAHRTPEALPNVPPSGSGEVVTVVAVQTLGGPNHKLQSAGLLLRMVDSTRVVTLNYKMAQFEGCPFGRALKSPVRVDIQLRGKVFLN